MFAWRNACRCDSVFKKTSRDVRRICDWNLRGHCNGMLQIGLVPSFLIPPSRRFNLAFSYSQRAPQVTVSGGLGVITTDCSLVSFIVRSKVRTVCCNQASCLYSSLADVFVSMHRREYYHAFGAHCLFLAGAQIRRRFDLLWNN